MHKLLFFILLKFICSDSSINNQDVIALEKDLSKRLLATRAVDVDRQADSIAFWKSLFMNQRKVKRLVIQQVSSSWAAEEVRAMLTRRIEEEGRDHHALAVAMHEVKPCTASASDTDILYWECSLQTFSSFQPFSPTVAFAVIVSNPLEAAVSRFYHSHETDHMRRHVPISKYFKAQARGQFSEEHLQHIRAFVVGGREFLKGQDKYRPYHDLGNAQFRKISSDPHKALDVIKALRMVASPSEELHAFLVVLRRRMAWPLRQLLHSPMVSSPHPTSRDWPKVYAAALNNTPKVRSDWIFYEGIQQTAHHQRVAFGYDKFRTQSEELGALQQELNRKCDNPATGGAVLECMLKTYDTCVVPGGRTSASRRTCGALLLAIGDGDSSF